VRNLRELDASHIPLLENLLTKAPQAITAKFGVPANQIRSYLHYMPSYHHLHVHFVHAGHDASFGMAVGKGHALPEVLGNLKLLSDFYSKATLMVSLAENNPLRVHMQAYLDAK
jgi:m7GpppX diphosphatase